MFHLRIQEFAYRAHYLPPVFLSQPSHNLWPVFVLSWLRYSLTPIEVYDDLMSLNMISPTPIACQVKRANRGVKICNKSRHGKRASRFET